MKSISHTNRWAGIGSALLAAFLFGVSTPLVKTLMPGVAPILMAGLLYLASGAGLGVYTLLRSRFRTRPARRFC